ncbi:hypothetical protein MRX96_002670 [Rhipicephalus microplus]
MPCHEATLPLIHRVFLRKTLTVTSGLPFSVVVVGTPLHQPGAINVMVLRSLLALEQMSARAPSEEPLFFGESSVNVAACSVQTMSPSPETARRSPYS